MEDFIGFKRYQPGDSLRSIDWKAFARAEELSVKHFSGRGSEHTLIDWSATAHLDDTELRLSQLALWVVCAEQNDMIYALRLADTDPVQFSAGPQHYHHCLRRLALYGLEDENA